MVRKKEPALMFAYHLLAYDEVDSTNDEAKRLARGGGAHGAVVWAKKQTAGRGRYARPWHSLPGNLFASMLLTPECDAAALPQLSFVAALAVLDAIMPIVDGAEVTCKWPNDILVVGKKLGGILLESFQHEGKQWAVVGVGLNVDSAPDNVLFPAISLKETGVELISAKIVLSRVIHHFIQRYDEWERRGFAPIRRELKRHAWRLGERITVDIDGEEIEGIYKDIDHGGGMVIQTSSREKRVIYAGDVHARVRAEEASA